MAQNLRYFLRRARAETPRGTSSPVSGTIISAFSRHPTAANLIMLLMVLVGLIGLTKLNRQIFPDFEVPFITVSVNWPGASAEDLATAVLDIIEPEVRFIDQVENVRSQARDGTASITLEFAPTANMQKAHADVEQAVSTLTTLPKGAEAPIVIRAAIFEPVARIALSGSISERALKTHATTLRDALVSAGIEKVDLRGSRREEIHVTVHEREMRRYGVGLDDIAQKVADNIDALPSGDLAGDNEAQIKSGIDRRTSRGVSDIPIKSDNRGQKISLGEIARVETRFSNDDPVGLQGGKRAIELIVKRSPTADTLKTMAIAQRVVDETRTTWPDSVSVSLYDMTGQYVEQRLSLLFWNGIEGLGLVLLALFAFLNVRIAFWTAAGIPIAVIATLGVMWATGQSLNMISMFALIMMIGIIVDDAIVVGEHTATLEEQGMTRAAAAEAGAKRMFAPVTAAILTTAASFFPIFFFGDRIGDIMRAIPLVVLAALLASMVECFLIMPAHLRHGSQRNGRPHVIRRIVDHWLTAFQRTIFRPVVRVAYRWRYAFIGLMAAALMTAFGAVLSERVRFVFFPQLEAENISASIYFTPGLPRDQQMAAVTAIEAALYRAETQLRPGQHTSAARENADRHQQPLVTASFGIVGQMGRRADDSYGEVTAQLSASEARRVRTREILDAWRRHLPPIAGVERVVISGRRSGPPGRDIDVRLQNAPTAVLKRAAEDLKKQLARLHGVSAIEDDLPYGKRAFVLELTPRGTALGFTTASIGQQIRNAFEGAIATQFARDGEEITVRVLREQELRGLAALYRMTVRTATGARIALSEAVKITEQQTFSKIQRRDGVTTVSVQANIDDRISTTGKIIQQLERDIMPEIAARYQLTYTYAGRADEINAALRDLRDGAILAIALIYVILAGLFGSYVRPFAVMAIVPFGFVGAVVGHAIMGVDMTMPSLIGLLGLSGILVNDSIVLVSRLIERIDAGDGLEDAAVGAACDRLRAVFLTSVTTIGGLTPLMFETNLQAQFLIPLAITLVFGLAMATVIVLILVPCFIGVVSDVSHWAERIAALYAPQRPQSVKFPPGA